MEKWKLQIDVEVADSWVADGFNLSERLDEVQEAIKNMLPQAYDHEMAVKVKILGQPSENNEELGKLINDIDKLYRKRKTFSPNECIVDRELLWKISQTLSAMKEGVE
jgi:hypothetical protein